MMTPEDRATAAELALGLLEGGDRADALERMLAEPVFATEVAWWRGRFEALFDSYAAAEPRAALRERVATLVAEETKPVATTGRRWRWFAGGAVGGALAASLATLLLVPARDAPVPAAQIATTPNPEMQRHFLLAAILPVEEGEPAAAMYDAATGVLTIAPARLADLRHSAQFWLIGADGVPHSLGLAAPGSPTRLKIGQELRARMSNGAVIAVSREPLGGSPSALPSGPVVAKGGLTSA